MTYVRKSSYKNAAITYDHLARVVRKVWFLYSKWETSQHDIDYNLYLNARENAEAALASVHPEWKKKLQLP